MVTQSVKPFAVRNPAAREKAIIVGGLGW